MALLFVCLESLSQFTVSRLCSDWWSHWFVIIRAFSVPSVFSQELIAQ